jgi:hypothetical protein
MAVLMGFDPGRDKSYGALAVLERQEPPRVHPHELPPDDLRPLAEVLAPLPAATYRVRYLERFARDLSHPQMVNAVVESWLNPQLPTPKTLLIDASGMGGHFAVDQFRLARVQPEPVVWHGGLTTSRVDGEWHVSKVRMVGKFVALVETRRITMHSGLAFGAALLDEMRQYLREQSEATGRERFHAASTGGFDDLISALVMCAWWGEEHGGKRLRLVPIRY